MSQVDDIIIKSIFQIPPFDQLNYLESSLLLKQSKTHQYDKGYSLWDSQTDLVLVLISGTISIIDNVYIILYFEGNQIIFTSYLKQWTGIVSSLNATILSIDASNFNDFFHPKKIEEIIRQQEERVNIIQTQLQKIKDFKQRSESKRCSLIEEVQDLQNNYIFFSQLKSQKYKNSISKKKIANFLDIKESYRGFKKLLKVKYPTQKRPEVIKSAKKLIRRKENSSSIHSPRISFENSRATNDSLEKMTRNENLKISVMNHEQQTTLPRLDNLIIRALKKIRDSERSQIIGDAINTHNTTYKQIMKKYHYRDFPPLINQQKQSPRIKRIISVEQKPEQKHLLYKKIMDQINSKHQQSSNMIKIILSRK